MKIKPILDKVNPKTFLEDYLVACGVKNVETFLNTDKIAYTDPWEYYYIDDAVEMLHRIIMNDDSKVGIAVDSDCDGQCSSALIYDFICFQNPKLHPQVYFHRTKQHGLSDLVDTLLEADIKYLIIPDASTNDAKECRWLSCRGIKILIMDHHEVTKPNPNAIVINPFVKPKEERMFLNENTSGTGVTYDVVRYYCERYNISVPDYRDLVATSLITDVCDLSNLENRKYIVEGLRADCKNEFLRVLFEKCCAYRGLNSEGVSFGIGPLANALCRMDLPLAEKKVFFQGLVGEASPDEALKVLRRVKREQDKAVSEELEKITIDDSYKTIIAFIDSENRAFTGLIGNKIMGEYNKPTFVLVDNGSFYSGSVRSPIPMLSKVNNSELANCAGHEEACGIYISKDKFDDFCEWLNGLNLDEKPAIEVASRISVSNINEALCTVMNQDKTIWGKGIPKPTFYLKFHVSPNDFKLIGAKKNTLKLQKQNVDFMKFFVDEKDIETLQAGGWFEFIVELQLNEWDGEKTKQAKIIKYEVATMDDDNWMDDF